ncbi:MAG: hypothetical protein HYY07_05730 [Elusimicrobia bacterium]|nr:hypothetical protein [Elusimicrobiota bacterium]
MRSRSVSASITSWFLLLIGFASLNGCAGTSTTVQQNLWQYATPAFSRDFHLVLVWKESLGIQPLQMAHPEDFVRIFGNECARRGAGRMVSYQILESQEELFSWIPHYKPGVPVLRVDSSLTLRYSTETYKADLQAFWRYQPFLLDMAPEEESAQSTFSKRLAAEDIPDLEDLLTWFLPLEKQLYRDFSAKFFSRTGLFERKPIRVFYFTGKTPEMKAAFVTAQSGDWPKAKQLWLQELGRDKNNPVLYLNLSAASQMLGEWDQALDNYQKFSFTRPRGLVGAFSGLPLESYYLPFLQGMALVSKHAKERNRFNPDSRLAILPFENYTNSLEHPMKNREFLQAESLRWGHTTVPIPEADEKLRLNGFTDGGQFRATTPASLGKFVGADILLMGEQQSILKSALSLVHAASGQTLFSKTVSGIGNVDRGTLKFSIKQKREYDRIRSERRKRKDTAPADIHFPDSRALAAQLFFRPWPRRFKE